MSTPTPEWHSVHSVAEDQDFQSHFFPGAAANRIERLIIPAEDLMEEFSRELGGELPEADYKEILAQIVCVLLNSTETQPPLFDLLPERHRIISAQLYSALPAATQRLAHALHQRVAEYGLLQEGSFPYFFDAFFGRDLVLRSLPY